MLGIHCSARSVSTCILFQDIDAKRMVREITITKKLKITAETKCLSIQNPYCNDNVRSPSQKIQSQAQRKHVVASGLLHRLHDNAGATGRDDEIERPDELPGGAVEPARINDILYYYYTTLCRTMEYAWTIAFFSIPNRLWSERSQELKN